MSEYGVLCDTASGGHFLVTLEADSPENAVYEVQDHIALFYGLGDAAGRWLAAQNPNTLTRVVEAKLVSEWDAGA